MTAYSADQREAMERVLAAVEAALIEFPRGSGEREAWTAIRASLILALGERRLRALA